MPDLKAPLAVDALAIATVTKLDPIKKKDVLNKLVTDTNQLRGACSATAKAVVEVGKILQIIHDRIKGAGRDGAFKPFVHAYCPFTVQTAYNYMLIAENFGGSNVAGYLQQFDITALHKLSSEEVPQEAVDDAVADAKKGTPITPAVATKIIKTHTEAVDVVPDQLGKIDDDAEVKTDKRDYEIPDKFIDTFGDKGFDEARAHLSAAKKILKRLSDDPSLGRHMDFSPLQKAINEVHKRIGDATPYALCPKCEGGPISKCTACNRAGWMPQYVLVNYEAHE